MNEFTKFAKANLAKQLKDSKAKTKQIEKAILSLSKIKTPKFRIEIDSAWADYGDKAISIDYEGSLKDAIESAYSQFCALNHRSEVQGSCHATLLVGDAMIGLPTEMYIHYFRKEK